MNEETIKSIGYFKNNVKKQINQPNHRAQNTQKWSGKHYKISIMRNTQPPKKCKMLQRVSESSSVSRQLWKQSICTSSIRKRNCVCLVSMEEASAIKKSKCYSVFLENQTVDLRIRTLPHANCEARWECYALGVFCCFRARQTWVHIIPKRAWGERKAICKKNSIKAEAEP